jgi:hypothetical protein
VAQNNHFAFYFTKDGRKPERLRMATVPGLDPKKNYLSQQRSAYIRLFYSKYDDISALWAMGGTKNND